jgi:tRNA nucleotidyltransferase (CCA-adding enzyme)
MRALCDVAREVHAEDAAPRPVLLGRHLIDEGWEPGPAMGEILRRAYEAQLDGAFDDLDGALAWLRAQTHDA